MKIFNQRKSLFWLIQLYIGALGSLQVDSRTIFLTPPAIEISTAWESSSPTHQPALSVSCPSTLRELHHTLPPPDSLIMFLDLVVIVSMGFFAYPAPFPLAFCFFLRACTVGNTLSPMLQTAGTTVHGRRNLFNRPRSISSFPSFSRGRLVRHAHDSLIVSTVIGSTPPHTPPGFVPFLSYSYNPLIRLADYCP